MELDVLGTKYNVEYMGFTEDTAFEKKGISGYHSPYDSRIVICRMRSHPEFSGESETVIDHVEKACLRHEIVHAFLHESGLAYSAMRSEEAWPVNEEMVDWVALQAPKIFDAFKAAGCL